MPSQPEAPSIAQFDAPALLRPQPVLLTLLLSLLSFGIYIPLWYLRRRAAFESLGSPERLNVTALRIVLAIYCLDAVLSGLGLISPAFGKQLEVLEPVAIWLDLGCSIVLLLQSFKVKRILQDAYGVELNLLFTFFFMHLYLQNWINHLLAGPKRKG